MAVGAHHAHRADIAHRRAQAAPHHAAQCRNPLLRRPPYLSRTLAAVAAAPASASAALAPPPHSRRGARRARAQPRAAAADNTSPATPPPLLPVTVISGFLGAGKTTLLNRILCNTAGLRVAVLVNDFAGINVDARLIETAGAELRGAAGPERVVPLSNGCICCSIRADLVREVAALAAEGAFDYLVVESTGVSVPLPVAATFGAPPSSLTSAAGAAGGEESGDGEDNGGLAGVARLDTLVTVVDAQRWVSDVRGAASLAERGLQVDEDDDRTVADLLVEQVECADVLVLNKLDLVSDLDGAALEALLRRLNPGARVLRATRCDVDAADVVLTGRFNLDAAAAAPGWLRELNAFEAARRGGGEGGSSAHAHDHHDHHHHHHHHRETEAERYGISSFVYHAVRPFHPARLLERALSREWGGVLRSKGFYWLATRHDVMGLWQSAGGAWQGEPSALWNAALPDAAQHPDDVGDAAWHPQWGDRCQELVWIGIKMDEPALRAMLDGCLLTDEEMALGPEGWAAAFDDPLPPWSIGDGGGVEGQWEEEGEWEEEEEQGGV